MREIYETREEYEMAMRSGIGNNYILPMESNEEVKVLQEKLEISVKECQQLKELLSKCLDELAEFNNSYYPETQELFSQITNTIGEK